MLFSYRRVHCVKLSKKKESEEEERKERRKERRREREKVVKASEHVVVYRHTYTKYKAEVESISKNVVLI